MPPARGEQTPRIAELEHVTGRLLLAPAVVGVIGTVAAVGYVTGYLWPVATQVWSLIAPRPCNEADWMG